MRHGAICLVFCSLLVPCVGATTLNVANGWNLKGVSEGLDTTMIPSSCYSTLWVYDEGGWSSFTPSKTTTVSSTQGFWIKGSAGGCSVEVSQSGSSSSSSSSTGDASVWGNFITPSQSVCESVYGGSWWLSEEEYNGVAYAFPVCAGSWDVAQEVCTSMGARIPTESELGEAITSCGGTFLSWDAVVALSYEDEESTKDANNNNASYQSCYKQAGFSYDEYWTSETVPDSQSSMKMVRFNGGFTTSNSKVMDYGKIRCIQQP